MTEHTPGPWYVRLAMDLTGYPMYAIAGMSGDQKRDLPTLQANARLIAAAPELLDLLRQAEAMWLNDLCYAESATPGRKFADAVRAAIAKATGKEERCPE